MIVDLSQYAIEVLVYLLILLFHLCAVLNDIIFSKNYAIAPIASYCLNLRGPLCTFYSRMFVALQTF